MTRVGRGIHLDRQQAPRGALRRPADGAPQRDDPLRRLPRLGRGRPRVSRLIMALGAVALGYGHPAVTEAAVRAVRDGVVGPLPPVLEEEVAAELAPPDPLDRAGALSQDRRRGDGRGGAAGARRHRAGGRARLRLSRLARLVPGPHDRGVPAGTRALYAELPFNDAEGTRRVHPRARATGSPRWSSSRSSSRAPDPEWLAVLREETTRAGALLIVDEIKTVCRLAPGGGSERFGIRPDLVVMAKAIANGFPLAAVGGRAEVMRTVGRTWISSTLATELVSLAAARATLGVMAAENVPAHLARVGRAAAGRASRARGAPPGVSCAAWRACRRCAVFSSTTRRPARHSPSPRRGAASSSSDRVQLRLAGARRRGDRPLAGDPGRGARGDRWRTVIPGDDLR